MAYRLFGTKPLSKPMLGHCQLELGLKFSEIITEIQNFSFTKMHMKKYRLWKGRYLHTTDITMSFQPETYTSQSFSGQFADDLDYPYNK